MRKGQHNTVTYDVNYFRKIDSEQKAYWLGFISADGWVHYKPKQYKYSFGFTLQERDRELVLKFMKEINCKNKICIRIIKNKKYFGFNITNKKMTEDLIRHGIVQNKSKILKTPNIPEKLKKHFYRGLMDGDGHIECNPRHVVEICGSYDIVKKFKIYFEKKFKLKNKKITKTNNIFYYRLSGISGKLVSEFLYKGNNICLNRKYKMVKKLIKYYNKKRKYHCVSVDRTKGVFCLKILGKIYGYFKNEKTAARKYNKIVKEKKLNLNLNII